MRILVTGGGGYVGTVLVRYLLSGTFSLHNRPKLTILDRFSWGAQPLLSVLRQEDTPRVRLVAGDIRDPRVVGDAIRDCDCVVHLAGIVGFPACDADPQDADSTNIIGTQVVVSAANTRLVVFASTGSTYGYVPGMADERTPINPLTRYGRTKALAEELVIGAGGVSLRLATLYGLSPRMRWDLLVHDFLRHGLTGTLSVYEGHARRTFLHVEDAAAAFGRALREDFAPGVWNIGSGDQNYTKQEIAERIAEVTGCTLEPSSGADPDRRDYAVSYTKVGETGWEATWTLEEALPGLLQAAQVWR